MRIINDLSLLGAIKRPVLKEPLHERGVSAEHWARYIVDFEILRMFDEPLILKKWEEDYAGAEFQKRWFLEERVCGELSAPNGARKREAIAQTSVVARRSSYCLLNRYQITHQLPHGDRDLCSPWPCRSMRVRLRLNSTPFIVRHEESTITETLPPQIKKTAKRC